MVLMLLGAQKQPGTPMSANPAAGALSPSSPLSNFKFNTIGQEPALLQRISSADEQLRYPPSPSSTSSEIDQPMIDVMPPSRPSLYDRLGREAETSSHSTIAQEIAAPQDVSTQDKSDPKAYERHASSVVGELQSGTHGGGVSPATVSASHLPTPSSASHTLSSFPFATSTSSPESRAFSTGPVLTPAAAHTESTSRHQSQNASSSTAALSSPAVLIAVISEVATERREWNDIKILMERFREAHEECLHRNEETLRALQREREQVTKVFATALSTFAKLEQLHAKQEHRLETQEQEAKCALDLAQKLFEQEKKREEEAIASAERQRRADVEEAELRQIALQAAQRKAAEEEIRRAADAEAKRKAAEVEQQLKAVEAEKQRQAQEVEKQRQAEEAKEQRQAKNDEERAKAASAYENLKVLEERRRAAALAEAQVREDEARKVEALKAAEDADRRHAEFLAKSAEVAERKRKAIEQNAIVARAHQQEERKTKPQKEEVKARLEKEKQEARSRSFDTPPASAEVSSKATNTDNAQPLISASTSATTSKGKAQSAKAKSSTVHPDSSTLDTLVTSSQPRSAAPDAIRSGAVQIPDATSVSQQIEKSVASAQSRSGPQDVALQPIRATSNTKGKKGTSPSVPLPSAHVKPEQQTPRRLDVKPEAFTPILAKSNSESYIRDQPPHIAESERLIIKREQSLDYDSLVSDRATGSATFPHMSSGTASTANSVPSIQAQESTPIDGHTTATQLYRDDLPRSSTRTTEPAMSTNKAIGVQYNTPPAEVRTTAKSRNSSQRVGRGAPDFEARPSIVESTVDSDTLANSSTTQEAVDYVQNNGTVHGTDGRLQLRLGYDHWSPTPKKMPARRVVDHYSPSPGHVPVRRDRSSANTQKRPRENDVSWMSGGEPLPRRPRLSPGDNYENHWPAGSNSPSEYARPPSPRHARTYEARTSSPTYPSHDFSRIGAAGGHMAYPSNHSPRNDYDDLQGRNSPPYETSYSQLDFYSSVTQDEPNHHRILAGSHMNANPGFEPIHSHQEQETVNNVAYLQRTTETDQSALLSRISDSQSARGGVPARNARNPSRGRLSPSRPAQRGRNITQPSKPRGGNVTATRGGARQQRPLASRLASNNDLGSRLS